MRYHSNPSVFEPVSFTPAWKERGGEFINSDYSAASPTGGMSRKPGFISQQNVSGKEKTKQTSSAVGNSRRLTLFRGELSSSISGHLEFPDLLLKPVNTQLSTARKPTWKCCTTIQSVQEGGKKKKAKQTMLHAHRNK